MRRSYFLSAPKNHIICATSGFGHKIPHAIRNGFCIILAGNSFPAEMRHREVRFHIRLCPQWIAGVADNVLTDWETFMSVSALSSSSSSYWEKMLAQMKGSSESQTQDNLAGKLFGDLDSDGDGTLSLTETGLSEDLYTSMDSDGDGAVSQTELQKSIETQRNAMFTSMQLGQDQTSSSTTTSSTGQPNAQELLSSIMNGQVPGGAGGGAPEGTGDDLASNLFSDLDSDSSGSLSASETGLSQSSFDAMDTDQDGSVSAEELSAALEKQRQAMMTNLQSEQSQSTSQSQTDSTSSSDQSDAQSLLSSIMNGQMPPPPPMQGQAASGQGGSDDLSSNLFSSLDSDSSDSLSMDETGVSQSVFDSMDVNQDGSVSADELATALEKQRAAMGSGQASTSRTEMAQSFLSAMANNAYQTLSQTTTATQSVEAVA